MSFDLIIHEIRRCDVYLLMIPREFCPRMIFQLGVAMLEDKPIVAITRPGLQLSDKVAACVDRFVEFSEDPEVMSASIGEVVAELKQSGRINR
jgi:hypothetical protein